MNRVQRLTVAAIVAGLALLVVVVVGALVERAIAAERARLRRAVYAQVRGPAYFPQRIVVRCSGWAEDSANLRLVEFTGERVVYRCIAP